MALSYGFNLGLTTDTYSSAQFSETFNKIIGDGVANRYNNYDITPFGGLTVNIDSGFAHVAGRWVKLESAMQLTFSHSSISADRYDAIAIRVDYDERASSIEIIENVDPDSLESIDGVLYLYIIRIRRGSASIITDDITDVRKMLTSFSEMGIDRLIETYHLFPDGLDELLNQYIGMVDSGATRNIETINRAIFNTRTHTEDAINTANESVDDIIDNADKLFDEINEASQAKLGDVSFSAIKPSVGNVWLPCDGGTLSTNRCPELVALVGNNAPDISPTDSRISAWICAGDNALEYYFFVDSDGNLNIDYDGSIQPFSIDNDGNLVYSGNENDRFILDVETGALYDRMIGA